MNQYIIVRDTREQGRPYNLSKLLYYIVKTTPSAKRVVYANNINADAETWKDDDELLDYGEETERASSNLSQRALLREQILVVPLVVYLAAWGRLLVVVLELL